MHPFKSNCRFQLGYALLLALGVGLPVGVRAGEVDIQEVSHVTSVSHRDEMRLSWDTDSPGQMLDLYVVTAPDMALDGLLPVASAIRAGYGHWQGPVSSVSRPYFVFTRANTLEVKRITAERLLPLAGGRNFRDMGGYVTSDGRQVKWGKVYRSGAMDGLTDQDYAYLEGLGIKVICDFRASDERLAEPTVWRAGKPEYLSWDYGSADNSSPLRELLGSGTADADQARQAMQTLYPQLLEQHKGRFRIMFARLLADRLPLAFNCSAGKDRTGLAAALLLTALGVPREQVVYDYAFSDDYVDYLQEFEGSTKAGEPYAYLAALPHDFLLALMASDPAYIETAFDYMDARYGSAENFIEQELGVGATERLFLRNRLLTQ